MTPLPITISVAPFTDAAALLALQKKAFYGQGILYNDLTLPPLVETREEYTESFPLYHTLKAEHKSRIVGSVRACENEKTCLISRLVVDPALQDRGVGVRLMEAIEQVYRHRVDRFELFTGAKSEKSLYLYAKLGYTIFKEAYEYTVPIRFLEKRVKGDVAYDQNKQS